MSKPSKKRQEELCKYFAEQMTRRNADSLHEYTEWDGSIECDGTLTEEELRWAEENLDIEVSVTVK